MFHRYSNDPDGSYRRHIIPQTSNNSSRWGIPPVSNDSAFQSTFEPHQERNPPHYHSLSDSVRSSNQMNNSRNDQPHRQYQLAVPSNHSYVRYPQSYHDDHQNLSRSPNRHYLRSQQPSSNQSYHYDQDYPRQERNSNQYDRRHNNREESYHSQSYPLQSNHRPVDVPVARQQSNSIRVFDQSSPSSHTHPVHRSSHSPITISSQSSMPAQLHRPASLLTGFLQSFFGEYIPSFNGDDHSSLAPIDLMAFSMMTQSPRVLIVPSGHHVHIEDLFDLLANAETPSAGLSDSDIQSLRTMTYRKTSKSKADDEKCAVCLSDYKNGETVKLLRCKHFFHSECIDPWLKTSTQCPICRGSQTG